MKKLKVLLLFSILLIRIPFILNINSKFDNEKEIKGIVNNYKIDGNKLTIELYSKEKIIVNYYFKTEQEKNYYSKHLKLGYKLKAVGQLEKPNSNRNFNLFNYKNYLLSKKINYLFKSSKIDIKKGNQFRYKFKNRIIERINKSENSKYLKLFIIGENTLDENINDTYKLNGISHLFAISGMHITLFTTIILLILNKINKNKIINLIIVFLLLIVYIFFTNYSPSVIRASLFFIILNIKKIFKIDISNFILILLLLILLLNYNPYYIYNTGFIYSFIISISLIYFENKETNYFKKLIKTSLIAFLIGLPITINTYNQVNLLAPIFNLIFVPIVSFIIFPLGLINFIFLNLDPIYNFLIIILENISILCAKITFMNIILCNMSIIVIIFYYLVIIWIIKNLNYKRILVLILILLIHSNINILNKYPIITMLDVGQGDSILITLPHNKGNILIDTGGITSFNQNLWSKKQNEYSLVKNITIPYLKSVGIKQIDYLILTHGDYDHLGEAINLINNYKIKNIIMNSGNDNNIEKKIKIKFKNIKSINKYNLNINNYELKFINKQNCQNENEDSLVIYTELNNKKVLLMGDAGNITEKYLLKEYKLHKVDILKVGHHGSKSSSSDDFINKIKPEFSIISAGINNRFGHPNVETIRKLKKTHSNIFITNINGMIKLILKDNIEIKTVF